MTLEANPADINALREERSSSVGTSALRHVVINLFNLIILLPLAWVLLMSVKSLPDAMRGDFWPRHFDFTHYAFVFHRIATLPINLFNSIYVTTGTVLVHDDLRGARRLRASCIIKPVRRGARRDGVARFAVFSRACRLDHKHL